MHGVVVEEGPVALQVELAEREDPQGHEGHGEHQAKEGVGSAATLGNAARGGSRHTHTHTSGSLPLHDRAVPQPHPLTREHG